MNKLLEVKSITKNFKKEKITIPVLKGISFEVFRGEMLALVGASGAGKSTLLHILGTLDEPTSGSVVFFNKGGSSLSLFNVSEDERAQFRNRHMGFVFQFHHLLPEFSAIENVMMPALIAGRSQSEIRDEAFKLLELVGLKHRVEHRPSELSGGECQRVALARALMMRPDIVFGDEITGNLDTKNSDMIFELLTTINKTYNTTFLLVTHDMNLASKMSRVLTIKDGVLC
jgi:lipoprotein-releasing system ATP-binding protein